MYGAEWHCRRRRVGPSWIGCVCWGGWALGGGMRVCCVQEPSDRCPMPCTRHAAVGRVIGGRWQCRLFSTQHTDPVRHPVCTYTHAVCELPGRSTQSSVLWAVFVHNTKFAASVPMFCVTPACRHLKPSGPVTAAASVGDVSVLSCASQLSSPWAAVRLGVTA